MTYNLERREYRGNLVGGREWVRCRLQTRVTTRLGDRASEEGRAFTSTRRRAGFSCCSDKDGNVGQCNGREDVAWDDGSATRTQGRVKPNMGLAGDSWTSDGPWIAARIRKIYGVSVASEIRSGTAVVLHWIRSVTASEITSYEWNSLMPHRRLHWGINYKPQYMVQI